MTGLQQATAAAPDLPGKAKSCIFIFLSGGLAQHESFDMKPDAPEKIRGEFKPIATTTPGIEICEHLPLLAQRSHLWVDLSFVDTWIERAFGRHHIMLTGRSELPTGFQPNNPTRSDFPAITSVAGRTLQSSNNLPPAVVLPQRLTHNSGRVIPGQHAGLMGAQHDPWMIEAASFHNRSYGAFPEYSFDHQERAGSLERKFQAPQLTLPHGLGMQEVSGRLKLLDTLKHQRRQLAGFAETQQFDRMRQSVISLLTDSSVHNALDVTSAKDKTLERYGRNSFGWSLLMARRLIGAGVNLVQVNLGNDETWDTHGNAFPHLKDKLFPPTDRAVSALLDDLHASGELDETLVVMASEFGRTPQISLLPKHYKSPGPRSLGRGANGLVRWWRSAWRKRSSVRPTRRVDIHVTSPSNQRALRRRFIRHCESLARRCGTMPKIVHTPFIEVNRSQV